MRAFTRLREILADHVNFLQYQWAESVIKKSRAVSTQALCECTKNCASGNIIFILPVKSNL
jgi:hypothetical protein